MTGLTPRVDQVAALTSLMKAFTVHDRVQLVMACGSGKTLISRWHAEAAAARRVVVFAPSRPLVAQLAREWRRARSSTGWKFPTCEQWWMELVARLAGDQFDLADRETAGDLANILTARVVAARIAEGQVRPSGYQGPLEADPILQPARRQAIGILADHAAWMDAVAAAVLRRGRLTGVDVMMLGEVVRDTGRPAGAAS